MTSHKITKLNQKWHNIDWNKTSKYISNLQKELVVAYKNNDQKLLFFLQEKLMMSFEGRALAVRRIVSNDGKKTPGFDKIIWNSPSAKFQAISQLREILTQKSGYYQAGPVCRTWIPKEQSDELRPLGIPNMIDRGLQALVLLCLDPIVEEMSDTYSFGFRKYRSTGNAIQRIRTILDKPNGPKWIWDVDIKNCFDKISHDFLVKEIDPITCPKAKEYVVKWFKAPIISKGVKTFPSEGTPQGGILSPLLCNIALNGLENAVRDGLPSPNSSEGIKALISDLNLILRGWTNYYRDSYHSQEVFQSVGHYIHQLWWKWAQKKHPNRNKKWIYNRYIFQTKKNSWRIGESKEILLFDLIQAKQLKIMSLRNNVNPYLDEDYYVHRTVIRDSEKFRAAIYKKHHFRCYVCEQALYGTEEIHLHHLIPRKDGGEYTLENIVPVHVTCHESITHTRKD